MPTPNQPFGQREQEKLERLREEQAWKPDELRIESDKPEMDDRPKDRGVEIINPDERDPRKRGKVEPTILQFK